MYDGVPAMPRMLTSSASSAESAISPKSMITTRPSGVTRMLLGLMSRWTLPAACSAARPLASWGSAARRRASSNGSGAGSLAGARASSGCDARVGTPNSSIVPVWGIGIGVTCGAVSFVTASRRRAASSGRSQLIRSQPSTSSIVKNHSPCASNSSYRLTRFAWLRSAIDRNSFLK